jgi:L-amino acid N-acyltransferase
MFGLNIRRATPEDLQGALDIFNDVVRTSTATFEENPRQLSDYVSAFNEKNLSNVPWLIAEYNGEIIGYGTYGIFRRASGYRGTVEHSLHVRADFRGKGVGSKILKQLIVEAKERSLDSMIACLDSSNTASIVLHEKFGFKKVGEIPRVAKKFARSLDLTIMQLILAD